MASQDQRQPLVSEGCEGEDSSCEALVAPVLRGGESCHVFISYSSADSSWAHSFIDRLESSRPGLRTCFHQRDFVPGRTVLENMSDCIHGSQKVLLVLSKDFLQSRWCLLEANLSLFRDCIERKPVVPVLLEPCAVPMHLSHLTYLEAWDPNFFSKVLKVLCTPNCHLSSSTVVPFQPPSVYNGKVLLTMSSVDQEDIPTWKTGEFSDMDIPDHLRLVIEDSENYKKAIRMINSVPPPTFCFKNPWVRGALILLVISLQVPVLLLFVLAIVNTDIPVECAFIIIFLMIIWCFMVFILAVNTAYWGKEKGKENLIVMKRRAGEANALLLHEKLLIGCESRTKLHFVYLSLEGCRATFRETFRGSTPPGEKMLHTALLYFSSGYACCVARKHFPFPLPVGTSPGHLVGSVCFCQYVAQRLGQGMWD